jgi:hypothetical protein
MPAAANHQLPALVATRASVFAILKSLKNRVVSRITHPYYAVLIPSHAHMNPLNDQRYTIDLPVIRVRLPAVEDATLGESGTIEQRITPTMEGRVGGLPSLYPR